MSKGITSTEGLIRKVFAIPHDDDVSVFYRGHSHRDRYKLEPSLYRNQGHTDSEHILFRELLIANPTDFAGDSSTFEKLVRMQHYSMPTRLLDITSNPLMALYFTCKSNIDKTGEVVLIKIRRHEIKFFDSDTASCIANLARLPKQDKDAMDFGLPDVAVFNESLPVTRLLHFVREEKPYFLSKVVPSDLQRILCVKGRMTNSRMTSQSGAFLLFGLHAFLPEAGNDDVGVDRITIKASEKTKILRELDSLNINESTVFPYIENSAKHIAKRYEA